MISIVIHEELEKDVAKKKDAIFKLWQKLQGLSEQELQEIQMIAINENGEIEQIK